MKKFDDGILQPSVTEADARWLVARELGAGALIRRMLKQRHACFLPQPLTKQHWRVNGDRQHRRGNRLGDVVMVREIFGVALKVNLKTGVTRFHHDVVVRQVQFVETFNVN